jgi:hypothetical protein
MGKALTNEGVYAICDLLMRGRSHVEVGRTVGCSPDLDLPKHLWNDHLGGRLSSLRN